MYDMIWSDIISYDMIGCVTILYIHIYVYVHVYLYRYTHVPEEIDQEVNGWIDRLLGTHLCSRSPGAPQGGVTQLTRGARWELSF